MRGKTAIFGFLAATFGFPVVVLLVMGFSGVWRFPNILPERFGLQGFFYIQGQAKQILVSLLSSFGYSVCAAVLSFLFCVIPASVFARRAFPMKPVLEAVFLAPALLPAMTFSMGAHTLFIRVGLADTFVGIVLVLMIFTYPYMLRALVAGYLAYPKEYDLCAKNLGAGRLMRIVRVEFPMLLPSVVAGGTVVFLLAFSDYFLVFLIGGGAVPSFTGYLFPFLNSSNRQVAALLTLVFLIAPVVSFGLIEATLGHLYRKKGMWPGG